MHLAFGAVSHSPDYSSVSGSFCGVDSCVRLFFADVGWVGPVSSCISLRPGGQCQVPSLIHVSVERLGRQSHASVAVLRRRRPSNIGRNVCGKVASARGSDFVVAPPVAPSHASIQS